MIHTFVSFRIKPNMGQEFESTHQKLIEQISNQPGCVEIKVRRSVSTPVEYMVYGTWRSKVDWDLAHQIPGFKELFRQLPIEEHTLSRGSFYEFVYRTPAAEISSSH